MLLALSYFISQEMNLLTYYVAISELLGGPHDIFVFCLCFQNVRDSGEIKGSPFVLFTLFFNLGPEEFFFAFSEIDLFQMY